MLYPNRPVFAKILACAMLATIQSLSVLAQSADAILVSGEVTSPLQLKKNDFSAFKMVSQVAKDKDGRDHTFRGPALIDILVKAGVTTGASLRGENLAKLVLIKAADGYQAVFSLPEIDPEFTDNTIIIAAEKDGQPLPAGEGPFRMIVRQDKKHARWVREVREIRVLFVKD